MRRFGLEFLLEMRQQRHEAGQKVWKFSVELFRLMRMLHLSSIKHTMERRSVYVFQLLGRTAHTLRPAFESELTLLWKPPPVSPLTVTLMFARLKSEIFAVPR